jgi:serine phosphatase RsbU (regulator of sigma subunit)
LASDAVLKKFLPEHFVMFKPKDIVSGDFYWFTHNEEGNIFYLAVCDSTGHGVPGAFMSLLNITYLNEAINEKEISAPGDVLNYVREKLIKNISQDGAKDGMDAILLRFTKEENKLKMDYAAANNAPFVVAANEIVEMPCDKMPVGKGDSLNSFSTYPLHLKKGDTLYLTTDGYADQFGGEKFGVTKPGGKKLKTANFKSILLEHSASEMMDQRNALIAAFDEWKGDFEQVDDVCVLGIAF